MQFFSSLKPLRQLLLIAVAAVAMVSCKDDEVAPTVSVSIEDANQSVGVGSSVSVTASASGGSNISYSWTKLSGPAATLTNANTATVSFNAATEGTYVLQVTATNSEGNSSIAVATIEAAVGILPIENIDGGTGTISVGTITRITANRTLTSDKVWRIRGYVSVEGATLTIQAGTILLGEKASNGTLIIKTNGVLEAAGTSTAPIVFTSDQPVGQRNRGDWGGVVWLGNGISNRGSQTIEGLPAEFSYGAGTVNTADNGTLQYARIEFGGIPQQPNLETNGLTMGALGNATVIDHVQVSLGKDDAFEWFGGAVNLKHIVSFRNEDDDLDTDFGYTGNVQFAFVLRDIDISNESLSNAFESDNNNTSPRTQTPITAAVFSNVTVLGPGRPQGFNIPATYQAGMHLRRNTAISLFNSVIVGFPQLVQIDANITKDNYKNVDNPQSIATGVLSNNTFVRHASRNSSGVFAVSGVRVAVPTSGGPAQSGADSVLNVAGTAATGNGYINTFLDASGVTGDPTSNLATTVGIPASSWNVDGTEPLPYAGSGTLSTGALFTNAKITGAGSFFTTSITFRGAVGNGSSDGWNWESGWLSWTPQSNDYTVAQD